MPRITRVSSWCAALLLATAAPAVAGEGLFLGWNNCRQGAFTTNNNFSCGTDAGFERLFCSFTVATAVDSVIGIEAVVDVQVEAADIATVPWWRMAPGECRDGS